MGPAARGRVVGLLVLDSLVVQSALAQAGRAPVAPRAPHQLQLPAFLSAPTARHPLLPPGGPLRPAPARRPLQAVQRAVKPPPHHPRLHALSLLGSRLPDRRCLRLVFEARRSRCDLPPNDDPRRVVGGKSHTCDLS